MALFRRLFYRKPPDRLLEISERVYVFDCCFTANVMEEDNFKAYMDSIVAQLQDYFPEASFVVFNFREGDGQSRISDILNKYNMTIMDYPRRYEGCPLLPLEMIHNFLQSCESWLSSGGQQNVLLMNCERGGWPVLAFMLSSLLLYRKQYSGEQKTLEMVYKQASRDLLKLLCPLNPQPSHLRYLHYISRRNSSIDWPPAYTPIFLDCIILRALPRFEGGDGCRPVIHVYGSDPKTPASTSSKLLFSTSKSKKQVRYFQKEECALVKIDAHCHIQGDVVLECVHLNEDLVLEEIIFRIMFHTAFVRGNILKFNHDEVDVLWDARDQFPEEFSAEVKFMDPDSVVPHLTRVTTRENGNEIESGSPEEFFEVEEIFSNAVDALDGKVDDDSLKVHYNKLEQKDVRREGVDPHRFQECAINDGIKKQDVKVDSSIDAVKDIAVDDVNYKLHKKMNSDTNVVKDIAVDEGDFKVGSVDFTTGLLRDRETNKVTEDVLGKLEYVEDIVNREDIVPLKKQRLETDISKPKPEKFLPASKKWGGLFPKPASDSALVKPKSKQLELQGHPARQAKPNAISRWIPPNKGSYANSMHVSYPPSRHSSAPPALSGTTALRKSKSGSNLKVSTGAMISKDVLFRQKSQKVDRVKASDSSKEISTTPIIPTSLPGLQQSVYIPPSNPQPSPPPAPPLPPPSPSPPRPSLLVSQSLQETTSILPSLPPGDVSRMPFAASPPCLPPCTTTNVNTIGMVAQSPVSGPLLLPSPPLSVSQTTTLLLLPPQPSSSRKSRYSLACTALHSPPPTPPHPSFVRSLGTSQPSNEPSFHPQPPPTAPIKCAISPSTMHEVLSAPSLPLAPPLCDSPSPLPPSLPPPVPTGHGPLPPPSLPPLPPFQYHSLAPIPLPPPMPLLQVASSPPPLPPPFLQGIAYGHSQLPLPMPSCLSPLLAPLSSMYSPLPSSPLSPLLVSTTSSLSSLSISTCPLPFASPPPPLMSSAHSLTPPSISRASSLPPLPPTSMSSSPLPPSPPSSPSMSSAPPLPQPSSIYSAPFPSFSPPFSTISVPPSSPPPPSICSAPLPPLPSPLSSTTNASPSPPPPPLMSNTTPPPIPPHTSPSPQLVPSSPPMSGASLSLPPLPPSSTISASPPPPSSPIPPSVSSAPFPPPPPPSPTTTAPPPTPPPSAPPPLVSSVPSPLPPLVSSAPSPPPPPPPPPGSGAPPPPPPPGSTAPPPPPPPGSRAPPPPPPPGGGAPGPPAPPGAPGGGPPPPPPSARGRGRGLSRSGAMTTRKSSLKPLHWSKVSRAIKGSLWEELQRHGEPQIAPEFDVSELERLFTAVVPKRSRGGKGKGNSGGSKTDKVHLIDLRRANNTEIMLTKVKIPLPEMMAAVLAMDDTVLDVDQVENLIKFCPTKEEMELLKNYTGDKETLGKCEQYFLELMKVPRVESKMRVFSFKIQFRTQISEFRRSLEAVNSACDEVRNSDKLKEIMKKILYLGNILNQGTARGSAVGFKLDSLLKLTDTRAASSKMTLMHYLCKVLAEKNPTLLDVHLDFVSLEAAAKIHLKVLAEEMQAIVKGLEKVKQELAASENEGPVSDVFRKTLKEFISGSEAEAASVTHLYTEVGKNADSLALYFGEDPTRCPFEQVTTTLLNFVRLFRKAHEENMKQAEVEQKKVEKEAETDKNKGTEEAE
ncbi:formin-like protein 14 [Hibiscus syriacus]|nr:formin-like protein 14 [Hibiscus syriacus]